MKKTLLLLASLLVLIATRAQAQFTYITNNGTITITGYTGSGGNVTIPSTISGLPVTSIGDHAFQEGLFGGIRLTRVTIPDTVTNIGVDAFFDCIGLTSVFIAGNAPGVGDDAFEFDDRAQQGGNSPLFATVYYLSGTTGWSDIFAELPTVALDGPPLFGTTADGLNYVSDQVKNTLITGLVGSNSVIVIPSLVNGVPVTGIWVRAFEGSELASITIPDTVTSIGDYAFAYCGNLNGVYFAGNAPAANWSLFSFGDDFVDPGTVYYLLGTAGWSSDFFGLPTALWLPQVQTGDASFGVRSNQFGFNIAWANGQTVVVEAATNLSSPVWLPVSTNTLVDGTAYFSDPQPANLPARFYRLRSP